MNTLVFGGSGLIGSRLVRILDADYTYFNNNVKIGDANGFKIDIRDKAATSDLIKKLKPDTVVHTAAVQGMDICETDKKLAYDVHISGTKNILDGCKSVDAKMIFISTSAVFDGKKKIYNEYDETCAISYYGTTKAEAEDAIKKPGVRFLIIRTDHPYGWVDSPGQKKNTVVRVLEKLEKGEIVEEITDWYNNPTFVDNLSEVIKKLIEKNTEGIYHTAGPDFLNRYEFALKIAEIFGKDKMLIKKKTSDKLNLPAKRTNCNLDSSKAQSETGIKLVGVEEGLKAMKKQIE